MPRNKVALSSNMLRSAITNGTAILAKADHRGAEMRRLKDLIAVHVNQLGGPDNVTHSEMVLIRRVSMMILQLELQESRFANQDNFEASERQMEHYRRLAAAVVRLLEALGLQRRARGNDMSLDEYLRGRQRAGQGVALPK